MALAWHSLRKLSRTSRPAQAGLAPHESEQKTGNSIEFPVPLTSGSNAFLVPAGKILYWPEPVPDVAVVVAPAFGTLKYPVAVDLLTLLITSSTAWRVPPV